MSDLVTLVNEQDEVIGQMDKIEAHRGSGVLHRAVSVFLFDKKVDGRDETCLALLQRRSAKKIVGALQWANTCCGNVRPDETHLECANRRLKEELGIICDDGENDSRRGDPRVALHKIATFQYQVRCNEEFSENEIDTVYVGRYDGTVTPNPDEVADIKWVEFDKFLLEEPLAPWVQAMQDQGILQKIQEEIWKESQ